MRQARNNATRFDASGSRTTHTGLLLLALALLCVVAAATAGAQSGRRKTAPISPVPTPTPAAPEAEGESESESRSRRQVGGPAQLSLVVYRLDNAFPYADYNVEDVLMGGLMDRLTRSKDLSASRGGKRISRKEAQEIAKSESQSHVVLVELEEDIGASGGRSGGAGQTDTRTLAVKTYVYEMGTGTLKFVDQTSQRPYRGQTTSIGGIRLPLPTTRTRMERFPGELQLEQAARDAADRLMHRFKLRPPPDN
ncbi:MAG TPA: hypothetical protein VF240_15805 [Pyrinomonadaceae bacterium]